MKNRKIGVPACAIGIAALPALGWSTPVFLAAGAQTPCAEEAAETPTHSPAPYVPPADVYVPESSKKTPADAGQRAGTNILIRNPGSAPPRDISDLRQPQPPASPGETPARTPTQDEDPER
jgi:hypothetical protein